MVSMSFPVPGEHGAAGTSPKGSVCMGQVFHSDTEHRLGLSNILNFMRFSYQESTNLILK